MSDIIKKSEEDPNAPKGITISPSSASPGGSASTSIKITGKSRLHSRLAASGGAPLQDADAAFREAAAKINEAKYGSASQGEGGRDPLIALHRIAVMADVSGSMMGRKLQLLKAALHGFVDQIRFDNTSVALYTFPMGNSEPGDEDYDYDEFDYNARQVKGVRYKLSFNKLLLDLAIDGLRAAGGTPMAQTMDKVITDIPLTRGIIISDGQADNGAAAMECAAQYAASETIIDTIHIGEGSSGEQLLQDIAKTTGGIYIKFTNVEAFAKAFSYLTPEGRATLMLHAGVAGELTAESKAAIAQLLGATEVK